MFADGACVSAEQQTARSNASLIRAQSCIAKYCLRRGGCMLLKTFAWYADDQDEETLALLRDVIVHFRDFVVLKPWHSRVTNDERYIFLRGFQAVARTYDLARDETALLRAE